MGIFNTASAFSGLGKASLKLDFETKEELNEYCARMLEASNPDGDGDEPEGGDRYLLHSVKGLEGLTQAQLYNYIFTHVDPITTPINIRGLKKADKKEIFKSEFGEYDENNNYNINTPIGIVKVNFNGLLNHLVKHATVKEAINVIKKTLQNPSVIFDSKDKQGNKSIAFIKAFLINGKPLTAIISSIDKEGFFLKSNIPPHSGNYIYNLYKRGGENLQYPSILRFDSQRENINGVSPEQFSFNAEKSHGACRGKMQNL